MFVAGAPFRHHQIVPTVFIVEVSAFGITQRGPGKQRFALFCKLPGRRKILLQHNSIVRITVMTRPPWTIDIVFTPIAVVKQ